MPVPGPLLTCSVCAVIVQTSDGVKLLMVSWSK